MNIFKAVQKYSPSTGKPDGFDYRIEKVVCDFTGEEIDMEDLQLRPPYRIEFVYDHACEEAWYYDDVTALADLLKNERGVRQATEHQLRQAIAQPEFVYRIINEQFVDASLLLVKEWLAVTGTTDGGFYDKNNLYFECASIATAARRKRYSLVLGFIRDKRYAAEQLGLVEQ